MRGVQKQGERYKGRGVAFLKKQYPMISQHEIDCCARLSPGNGRASSFFKPNDLSFSCKLPLHKSCTGTLHYSIGIHCDKSNHE